MEYLVEQAKRLPVINDVDIVVLGGGCPGTFAAIRAARLGAKVALIERSNCFGGVATNGFVCVWHVLTDTTYKKKIIGGLTQEVIERLQRVPNGIWIKPLPDMNPIPFREPIYAVNHLNTEELKIELDKMITESGVVPYLHTFYSAPYTENGKLKGVIVENSSARGIILGKFFIDATGDGYLGEDMGMETYNHGSFQPATTAAKVWGWEKLDHPNDRMHSPENKARIGARAGWDDMIPGAPSVFNWYKSQFVADCSNADNMTQGEINGRAQVREMMNILREQDPDGNKLALIGLSSVMGVRETRQLKCSYQLTADDLCNGHSFDDAIAYCAYPIDIHTPQEPTRIRYLDGWEQIGSPEGIAMQQWKDPTDDYATYWQIPYRSMLPEKIENLLICGRAIDADKGAFAAARVMISLNQTGEAAGVASWVAMKSNKTVQDVDIVEVQRTMVAGGSIIPE